MEPLWGNQHPDFLTSLMNMSLVLRLPGEMHLCRSPSNVPRLPMFLKLLQNPHVLLTFDKVQNPLRLPRKTTSERPKVFRTPQFFALLTSKCASRHNGVHFFDISTSKSGPNLVCFVYFDFEMCFAPQRRALFRHLNFQKWSEPGVFCIFWLRNVLRATTACTFSTSQLPKVVRTWCVLYILTSKCASRHNGVHFFDISTSQSGPFDFEMCFAPQRPAFFRHLNFSKWSFWLRNVLRTTTACTFSTSQLPKVVLLTSKCASHHNGVHFFDISTSKSGPNLVCFVYFDFEMCFAPQRRALFRHLNFPKWSFWLRNVLRTTTACTFSTSQLPKVVLLTSKCASHHNGVHFFDVSTSKSGPNLVCFVYFDFEMCFAPQRRALFRHLNFPKWSFWLRNVLRATTACTFSSLIWSPGSAPAALASLLFDPPEPQIIGKTQCSATFLPFRASASSFFWLFLFSDLLSSTLLFSLPLPCSAFHLSNCRKFDF